MKALVLPLYRVFPFVTPLGIVPFKKDRTLVAISNHSACQAPLSLALTTGPAVARDPNMRRPKSDKLLQFKLGQPANRRQCLAHPIKEGPLIPKRLWDSIPLWIMLHAERGQM